MNFVKNVLPRLVGKPAQAALKSLDISLTDKSGNLRDIVQVYTEVANKIKNISDSERIAVVEGLAGKFHISRMQAFLDDLGSADSMYRKMEESSRNSAGSAMNENEQYMKSLEARTNLARVEIEKLALAVGDAFLTEGMVQGIQMFGKMLGVMTDVVKAVGVLPVVFGTAGFALLLLSTRFKTLSLVVQQSILGMLGFGSASRVAGASTASLGTMVKGLGASFKTLVASTGLAGVAFIAIGYATEKLLGHFSKQREAQEAIAQENREMARSYKENGEEINKLASKYKTLQETMRTGTEKEKTEVADEYLEVQNKLAELMPNLSKGEDEYGNVVLGNATILENRIKLIEKQIEAEEKLQKTKEEEKNDEELKTQERASEKSGMGRDYQIEKFDDNVNNGFKRDKYDEEIKTYEDMAKAVEHYEKIKADYAASGNAIGEIYTAKRIKQLEALMGKYSDFSNQYSVSEAALASSSFESTEKIIADNVKLSDSTKELATGITSTIATIGIETDSLKGIFSGITDGLEDTGQLKTFIGEYVSSFDSLKKAQRDGLSSEDLQKYLTDAQNSFGLVRDEVLQTARANGVLENSIEYAELSARLNDYANANILTVKSVEEMAKATGMTVEQVKNMIIATSEGEISFEDFEQAVDGATGKVYELKDAIDQMSGVSQQQINDTEDLTWQYDMLSGQLSGLTEGTNEYNAVNDRLVGVKEQLLALYPQLFDADQTAIALTDAQIQAIKQEVEANDILRSAYKASRDGKLTSDEDRALSGLQTAKDEIHNINEQIKALNKLAQAYRQFAASSVGIAQELADAGLESEADDAFMRAQKWQGFANQQEGSMDTYKAQLAEVSKTQKGFIDTLKQSEAVMGNTTTADNKNAAAKKKAEKSTKGSDKAQKTYNETLKESIYLANTYKEALEKISLEQSRLNEIKSKYPTHSKEYQDAMEKELAVLYEKKALIQGEAKYINQQITTGNPAKTGIVTKGSGSTYTGKYATEVNKAAAKHGIDANLIAAVIQAESGFNPNAKSGSGARGLMQLMPSTAKGLGVKDSYNAEQNIMGGAKYLAQQLKAFGGDIKLALAAYNAGPGNVKKHGGIPPFKETQNYVKKITDALAKTSVSAAKIAGQSVADYYSGNGFSVSSGFGKRTAPKAGASTDHQGLDLSAKAGTAIKSLRAGKVIASYYHDKSGNAISIQQDDGTVAKYFHMQSKSKLVAGQSVKAGDEIGKVGNTGNSKGNHLHLQIEQSGKAVDPLPYLKAQGQSISDASQAIAENLQDLDALRSDLNAKSQDIFAVNEEIRQLQRGLIDVELDKYAKKQKVFLGFLDEEIAKKESLDLTSTRYQNSLKRSIKYIAKQSEEYKKELTFLESMIKNGKLDAKVKEEMQEKAEALRLTLVGLNNEMKNFSVERINASQQAFAENISDITYEIEKSRAIMSLYEDGSIEYNKEFASQIEGMKSHQQQIKEQRDSLQRSLLLHDLNPETVKEYKNQIKQLGLEYWNLESSINSSAKELIESEKKMKSDLADRLIASYKSYIDETKTMKLRSLDEEMKAEDRRHKKVADNLRKEMDIYRDLIQTKLDSIDKEETETDYNKEMDKLGADKTRIQGELNLLSMDDSYEAKSQRKKLQEELTVLDETILDKRHKREVDLRKENLQEMLTVKEEAIAKEEEAEQLIHDNAKDRIDDLKTYWDQFYTDQLNDERRFAQLREDVMKGNFDNISAEFKGYLTEMEETMPSLENTMDGTMQAVGTSIRQNIIDALKEAVDLMGQVSGGGVTSAAPSHQGSAGAPPSGGSSGGTSGGSGKSLSGGDLSVLGGKFLADKLRSQETNNSRRETITDRARSMAADGRSQGSTLAENKGFDELVQGLSASEKSSLADYLKNRVHGMFSTPNLQDFISNYIKVLESSGLGFKTGGPTGKGGLGLLHEKEFVLNEGQTKEAFKMADLFANLNRFASMITTPKQPTLAGASSGGDTYHIDFNVDKMTGNESDVNKFTKSFTDALKRNKGVR